MPEFECTNCKFPFPDVGAFFAHREDCRLEFKKKPHYEIIEKGGEMPNRMQNENRKWIVRYLTARDGYQCIHCGKHPARGDPPLQVDHADGDENNWKPGNIHLTCQNCNLDFRKLKPADHIELISKDSAKNGCVHKEGSIAGEIYQNMVNTDDVPIEIRINSYSQSTWENWLREKIDKEGIVTQFDAIYGGAKAARCNPRTTEKYFKMAISCEGEYDLHKEKEGSYITRRSYEH